MRDTVDAPGRVGRAEGIRRWVGMSHDVLERLLRVLKVGHPLSQSPVVLRQPLELGLLFREDFLRKEGAGCNGNKPRIRDSKASSPGLPFCGLGAGKKF